MITFPIPNSQGSGECHKEKGPKSPLRCSKGRPAMRQVVIDGWTEAYAADRDASLLDLIRFFIQCCGCKGNVHTVMTISQHTCIIDAMDKMVDELVEDSDEYPLIQPGPYGRWFHSELCDFVSVLVCQCQHSLIFDSYLINMLISLLSELADSHIRAFRHTCTLAGNGWEDLLGLVGASFFFV
uniref:STAG domain-containing protein n=1 Tax=Hippocampus comes TaxID=109280 RepID=A0A3Q2Y1H0_HIPCM